MSPYSQRQLRDDIEVSDTVLESVANAAQDSRISCGVALKLAQELSVTPRTVGEAANRLKIRIEKCQLGCF